MGWFVLRPTGFLDMTVQGFIGKISGTCWKVGSGKDNKMQFIATKDIGWFAAQRLVESEKLEGKASESCGMGRNVRKSGARLEE